MFTEEDRGRLLAELIDRARADPGISAAALVGSAARRATDQWSDIDLALGLAAEPDVVATADRWTRVLAEVATVADTLDLWAGPALYRVFLLHSSLQVDVSFWPASTLAPTGDEPFEHLFGEVADPTRPGPPDWRGVLGWGWLYALHARSAIARRREWQALQMLERLRDQVITLTCLRYGLPPHHGRGVDQLPVPVRAALTVTVPAEVRSSALVAAYTAAVRLLVAEAEHLDPALASRLRDPLATLISTAMSAVP